MMSEKIANLLSLLLLSQTVSAVLTYDDNLSGNSNSKLTYFNHLPPKKRLHYRLGVPSTADSSVPLSIGTVNGNRDSSGFSGFHSNLSNSINVQDEEIVSKYIPCQTYQDRKVKKRKTYKSSSDDLLSEYRDSKGSIIYDNEPREEGVGIKKCTQLTIEPSQPVKVNSQTRNTRGRAKLRGHATNRISKRKIRKPAWNHLCNLDILLSGGSMDDCNYNVKSLTTGSLCLRRRNIVEALKYLLYDEIGEKNQGITLTQQEQLLASKAREVLLKHMNENSSAQHSSINLSAISSWAYQKIPSPKECASISNLQSIVKLINSGKWTSPKRNSKSRSTRKSDLLSQWQTAALSLQELLKIDPNRADKSTLDALIHVKDELREIAGDSEEVHRVGKETNYEMEIENFSQQVITTWVRRKISPPESK